MLIASWRYFQVCELVSYNVFPVEWNWITKWADFDQIESQEAVQMARDLAAKEGLLVYATQLPHPTLSFNNFDILKKLLNRQLRNIVMILVSGKDVALNLISRNCMDLARLSE